MRLYGTSSEVFRDVFLELCHGVVIHVVLWPVLLGAVFTEATDLSLTFMLSEEFQRM